MTRITDDSTTGLLLGVNLGMIALLIGTYFRLRYIERLNAPKAPIVWSFGALRKVFALPENDGILAAIRGDLDKAEAFLATATPELARAVEVEAAKAQLELAKQAAKAGPLDLLLAAVDADPGNAQARFDLALAMHAAGQVEAAVDQLLDLFRRDRDWNDGAAKAQLMTIFDALKPTDPIVLKGRRRLSSMIFA